MKNEKDEEVWAEVRPRTLVLALLITLATLSASTLVCVVCHQAFVGWGFWGGLGVSSFIVMVAAGLGALVVQDCWRKP